LINFDVSYQLKKKNLHWKDHIWEIPNPEPKDWTVGSPSIAKLRHAGRSTDMHLRAQPATQLLPHQRANSSSLSLFSAPQSLGAACFWLWPQWSIVQFMFEVRMRLIKLVDLWILEMDLSCYGFVCCGKSVWGWVWKKFSHFVNGFLWWSWWMGFCELNALWMGTCHFHPMPSPYQCSILESSYQVECVEDPLNEICINGIYLLSSIFIR
jgi:hypothetical protein